jgi:methyl-accepting chemotaxis protein
MLSNLKIGVRLSIGFIIALIALILVAFIGITRVGELQGEINSLVKDKIAKTKLANDMIDHINDVGRFHRNMLITRNDETTNREMDRVVEARSGVAKSLEALDKFSYSDKGKAALDACKEARKPFVAASLKLEEQIKAKQWDEALKHFDGTYRPLFTAYVKEVNTFIDFQTELTDKVGSESEALANSTRTLLIGLAVAAVLIVLLLAFLITRSITGPTGKLVAATGKMAIGDFSFKLDIDSKDEVGQLAKGCRSDAGRSPAHDQRRRPAGPGRRRGQAGDARRCLEASRGLREGGHRGQQHPRRGHQPAQRHCPLRGRHRQGRHPAGHHRQLQR